MPAYSLVAVAVFTVLATTLFRLSQRHRLHGSIFVDDVQTTLGQAATEKRPLWETFHALARRYGEYTYSRLKTRLIALNSSGSMYSFYLRGKPVVGRDIHPPYQPRAADFTFSAKLSEAWVGPS